MMVIAGSDVPGWRCAGTGGAPKLAGMREFGWVIVG
jgi:hypothetical protein